MSRTWILCDVSYLCWRAFHTTGTLEHEGVRTGVLYGFLRTIKGLQAHYGAGRTVFCFDMAPYKRKEIYPAYKSNRTRADNEEKERALGEVRRQIELLRTDYLERVGFKNVFFQMGMEADDIIASCVDNIPSADRALIVSGDKDLYQLISPTVSVWNPKGASGQGRYGPKWFGRQYGISPDQWVEVKAIAGCSGDNVYGVRGVGEITACAYIRGRAVNRPSKLAIQSFIEGPQYKINKRLVTLPYEGCRKFKPVKDELDDDAWDKLMKSLGMTSLTKKDF